MKKGISLIVLVITIIVMIVIAAAIILSLNSSNVTGKASWAQISADRANLQSEYATILADVIASEKIDEDYVGVTLDDVTKTDAYKAWAKKVTDTNANFDVDTTAGSPAGVKVVWDDMSVKEAEAFGLTRNSTTADGKTTYDGTVKGYDWVTVVEEPAA